MKDLRDKDRHTVKTVKITVRKETEIWIDLKNHRIGIKYPKDKKADWWIKLNNPLIRGFFKCSSCECELNYVDVGNAFYRQVRQKCSRCKVK